MFCLNVLLILFSNLTLYLIYLLFNIFYDITNNFCIYLFILQYKNFLIMSFINRLVKNLSILYLIIFNFEI